MTTAFLIALTIALAPLGVLGVILGWPIKRHAVAAHPLTRLAIRTMLRQ